MGPDPARRRAGPDETWRLRDEAIAEKVELRDLDRVNAMVQWLRYGDRHEPPYNKDMKPQEKAPRQVPAAEYARRIAGLDEAEEIRQRALANGMRLLSDDEINAEVQRRRYGSPDEEV